MDKVAQTGGTAFNWLLQMVIGGAAIFCVILLLFYLAQNSMLYIPVIQPLEKDMDANPPGYRHPREHGIPSEEVYIDTRDQIRLHGWFMKQSQPEKVATVVFYHENAGNIGTRLQYVLEYYTRVKVNILLVAYRGYSKSTGTPTEFGIQIDGKAIIEYLLARSDIDHNKIFIHGRSLGGAVAIYTLAGTGLANKVKGVILENTFTSIPEMVDSLFPKLSVFKGLILRNFWPSIERIPNISQPILFILCITLATLPSSKIALKDEIVPPEHMQRLIKGATNARFKETYEIAEGNHNMNWSLEVETYFDKLSGFIQKCEKSS